MARRVGLRRSADDAVVNKSAKKNYNKKKVDKPKKAAAKSSSPSKPKAAPKPRKKPAKASAAPKPRNKPEKVDYEGLSKRSGNNAGGPRKKPSAKKSGATYGDPKSKVDNSVGARLKRGAKRLFGTAEQRRNTGGRKAAVKSIKETLGVKSNSAKKSNKKSSARSKYMKNVRSSGPSLAKKKKR